MYCKFVLSLCCLFVLIACDSPQDTPAPAAAANEGETTAPVAYEMEAVVGSETQRAVLRNAAGKIIEEGFMEDGLKQGTWLTYGEDPEKPFPQKMISYVDDIYNGPYLEFSDNGSISIKAFYVNNKLHGDWGKYRFGRPESEAQYVNGELDGVFREYNFRDGNLKKEIYYKQGAQDGPMRFYDEEENLTIEFIYRNGEKISENRPEGN